MKNALYLVLLLVALSGVLSAGCTRNEPAPVPPPGLTTAPFVPPVSADNIKNAASPFGTLLTDARGMTLYFFADDIPGSGNSTCYGGCAKFWPVVYIDAPTVSSPLKAADFTVITLTDGSKQTCFRGWPLYYFSQDKIAGDTRGENIQKNWSVARPDYTVIYSEKPGLGTFLTAGPCTSLGGKIPGKRPVPAPALRTWPLFSSSPLVAPSLLNAADFSVTVRPDGPHQSLYKGRPLYYFAGDMKPGDTNGEGILNA